MAESILLTQKDNSTEARKEFIKRFNKITGGDFRKLTTCEFTDRKFNFIYWDFSHGEAKYKLEFCLSREINTLYQVN